LGSERERRIVNQSDPSKGSAQNLNLKKGIYGSLALIPLRYSLPFPQNGSCASCFPQNGMSFVYYPRARHANSTRIDWLAFPPLSGCCPSLINSTETAYTQGASCRAHSCCPGECAYLSSEQSPMLHTQAFVIDVINLLSRSKLSVLSTAKSRLGLSSSTSSMGTFDCLPYLPSSNHRLATSLAVCVACPL